MPVCARVCPRVSVRVPPSPAVDDFSSVNYPQGGDPHTQLCAPIAAKAQASSRKEHAIFFGAFSLTFAINTCDDYKQNHNKAECCGEESSKIDRRIALKNKSNDNAPASVMCKFVLNDEALIVLENNETVLNMTYLNDNGFVCRPEPDGGRRVAFPR